MDWKRIFAELPTGDYDDERKEEIYENLIVLERKSIEKKNYRKFFELAIIILKYKGNEVAELHKQIDSNSAIIREQSKDSDEILRLQTEVDQLTTEQLRNQTQIQELNRKLQFLQKTAHTESGGPDVNEQDEDSPDVLSEIDRQEDLLNNINTKNKHIKRLLRDIDVLEKQLSEQIQEKTELKYHLENATESLEHLTNQIAEQQRNIGKREEILKKAEQTIADQQQQINALQKTDNERRNELKKYTKELEDRIQTLKYKVEDKTSQLTVITRKYEEIVTKYTGYDTEPDRIELKRLTLDIKQRDNVIKELEDKIVELTRQVFDSTNIMNSLAQERENMQHKDLKSLVIKQCCEETRDLLEKSNSRCRDLQDMLTAIEEDNIYKSKQTSDAIEALHAYQTGENGLIQVIKKNQDLQQKINSRDKQIRALIIELNSAQDLAQENAVLRKRLGISDDELLVTKPYAAKQRKLEKTIERLSLKLRASEELRLQLQLEKNNLRRQLNSRASNAEGESNAEKTINEESHYGPTSLPIEIGDIEEFNNNSSNDKICKNCKQKLRVDLADDSEQQEKLEDNELKYSIVLEENENLRKGMHEILDHLRNYSDNTHHITVDKETLDRVLNTLDRNSPPSQNLDEQTSIAKDGNNSEELIVNRKNDENEILPEMTEHNESNEKRTIENLDDFYNCLTELEQSLTVKDDNIEEMNKKYQNLLLEYDEFKIKTDQTESITETTTDQTERENLNLKIQLSTEKKKSQFLHEDYQLVSETYKAHKDRCNRLLFTMRKEVLSKDLIISLAKLENEKNAKELSKQNLNGNNTKQLNDELIKYKLLTSNFCKYFMQNVKQFDPNSILQLNFENISKIGIINSESIVIDVISSNEYDQLKDDLERIKLEKNKYNIEFNNSNSQLTLLKKQIKNQQQILTRSSEEDLSLRHMIVDLQSQSNESYIIAKSQSEIDQLKHLTDDLKIENNILIENVETLKKELQLSEEKFRRENEMAINNQAKNELKIRFLITSLIELYGNYAPYMPLYAIAEFTKDYNEILYKKQIFESSDDKLRITEPKVMPDAQPGQIENNFENKIQILKYQNKCQYLEELLRESEQQIDQLKSENDKQKLKEIYCTQHWETIKLLFDDNREEKKSLITEEVQTSTIEYSDKETNTEESTEIDIESECKDVEKSPVPAPRTTEPKIDAIIQKSLESQLNQAIILASTRSALLLETENRLSDAHNRIKTVEHNLEERDTMIKELREKIQTYTVSPRPDDNILSVTITSLQNLMLEKDTTMSRYQELLKMEREDRTQTYEDHRNQIRSLHNRIDELENQCKVRDRKIDELQVERLVQGSDTIDRDSTPTKQRKSTISKTDSFPQLPDQLIEEMFLDEQKNIEQDGDEIDLHETDTVVGGVSTIMWEDKLRQKEMDISRLQNQLREVSEREILWEKKLTDKEEELTTLTERIASQQDEYKEITNTIVTAREVEELRQIVEEKDRHISELTETLTHFHDDEQKFLTETSLNSTEHMTRLSADLSRSEASNRILQTQINALKRQIASLGQREKQARNVVQTLKTQLIKRPVLTMKPERLTTSREDSLQKRLHQMENELKQTKEELQKQTTLAQAKKAKDASDLSLWDKQKRFQQQAENCKMKLKERECELDKLRVQFATAKNTIARLEREKLILENRARNNCCQCQTSISSGPIQPGSNKYTPAETPESCQTIHSDWDIKSNNRPMSSSCPEPNSYEIIEILKNRVEAQQRRIVAMELEGKGKNALTRELERLHEKMSALEAHNLRLESRHLQLQLDNDVLRQQGNGDERKSQQIKHLEDYILVLKDELSQALASCKHAQLKSRPTSGSAYQQNVDQTILSLRRVVERLKIENKQLRDGRGMRNVNPEQSKESYDKLKSDLEKTQQCYSEALDKISSLQIDLDLEMRMCQNCKGTVQRKSTEIEIKEDNIDLINEMRSLKEKLVQKTQLLEKAKILLARAAGKEKNLREQIIILKRRCSKLQNVPVIDEISE